MPIIKDTPYNPPFPYKNSHFNTVMTSFARQVPEVRYVRERIATHDGDFIDLDYAFAGSDKICVLLHGLEGSSASNYMKGMARALNRAGYDAVAMNFRGCGGETNRLHNCYHSGKTDDLELVLEHIGSNCSYKHLFLVGYSLGGNVALKYSGENASGTHPLLRAIVGVSVPIDLKACAFHMAKPINFMYLKNLLDSIKQKAVSKKERFPDAPFEIADVMAVKDFPGFDQVYTAPSHGFRDAEYYWEKCNSKQYLTSIKTPSLLISALDDPFLPASCFPFEEARKNPDFYFEPTPHGGHIGFISSWFLGDDFWHEKRILEFFEKTAGF